MAPAPQPRSIAHGARTGYASLGRGGLDLGSLPMRLFAKGNAKPWNPAAVDLSQDAHDIEAMTDAERWWTFSLAAGFMAGEEAVTQDLQPFIAAMAAEGRLADELYLTQFVYEEAKHTAAFRRWFDAVGATEDLHPYVEDNPHYRRIFTQELPDSLHSLTADPSPRNQIRASVTYNHIIEGTLALTGYYSWNRICTGRGILPGMQQIIRHIGDDERRHMAWGTFTCRRHVAADDRLWDEVQDRMQELMPIAVALATHRHEQIGPSPFGTRRDEVAAYATDKVRRRLGAIASARGADVRAIDLDTSPEQLEERFHAEDTAALAG